MSAQSTILAELADEWSTCFAQALQSLLGTRVMCAVQETAEIKDLPDCLCWQQQFAGIDDGTLYVAASGATWRLLSDKVLHAAGLDKASEQEIIDTYCELLTQASAGLAHSLTARAQREIVCAESVYTGSIQHSRLWLSIQVNDIDENLRPLYLTFGNGLAALWQTAALEARSQGSPVAAVSECHTLGLLLDVELPISVSFGRSPMPIKDVLKLTTGSVIELDRAVTEPVDLIVNNCVIARGEVVVVDGDYGVRISQIMSREARIRNLR